MTESEAARTKRWAEFYRGCGFQPLPSDPGAMKPLCRFAKYWESPAPPWLFDRFPTRNIQVMTGSHWGLAVLDLDGEQAVEVVTKSWPALPRTWTVWHSDGGRKSRHLWFRLPPGCPPRRKRVVWAEWDSEANDWRKHSAVELLVDRSLIMAPPSVHPKTGNAYGFASGCSPREMAAPAVLPGWVWRLPAVTPPPGEEPPAPTAAPFAPRPSHPACPAARSAGWAHVLDAIPDKAEVARRFGLRFASEPSHSDDWVSVHDFNRKDDNPSARFSVTSGRFWRPGIDKPISLFELGAQIGAYSDWQACKNSLAEQYLFTRN